MNVVKFAIKTVVCIVVGKLAICYNNLYVPFYISMYYK